MGTGHGQATARGGPGSATRLPSRERCYHLVPIDGSTPLPTRTHRGGNPGLISNGLVGIRVRIHHAPRPIANRNRHHVSAKLLSRSPPTTGAQAQRADAPDDASVWQALIAGLAALLWAAALYWFLTRLLDIPLRPAPAGRPTASP